MGINLPVRQQAVLLAPLRIDCEPTYRKQRHQIQSNKRNDVTQNIAVVPRKRPLETRPRGLIPAERPAGGLERGCGATALIRKLQRVLNGLCEGGRVRALDGLDRLAAVEDDEGGHGADAVGAGNGGLAVDIDLAEGDLVRFGVFSRETFDVGCDLFARAAPVGVDCHGVCQRSLGCAGDDCLEDHLQSAITTLLPLRMPCHWPADWMLTRLMASMTWYKITRGICRLAQM